MSNQPRVTICIPTFNGAPFLQEAFDSAEAQTFDDLEIVVSDSGSTDGTVELIQSFQSRSRFPVRILPPPPPGMVANWNHCIAHATGDYIKFLFQDDLLEPDCIAQMVTLADEDRDIDLVFSPRHLVINDEARKNQFCQSMEIESDAVHLGWSNLKRVQSGRSMLADPGLASRSPLNKIGEPTVVLLRHKTLEQVGTFDSSLRQVVDLEMWWRMMGHGKVGFIDTPLASFRIHPAQASVRNSDPLQVTAELKRFAQTVLREDYAREFAPTSRDRLQRMADKNLLVEFLRLQYRKPVTWIRKQLGLGDSVSWKTLFTKPTS